MDYRAQRNRKQQQKDRFYMYTACLAVLSASLPLMPFSLLYPDRKVFIYLPGILFWVGLIGTIITAVRMARTARKDQHRDDLHPNGASIGLFHFFENKPACVFDVLMLVSLVGLVVTRIWAGTTLWPFVFLPILTFSFGMHCMLNGSSYRYIQL